jgi:hypothetical protein
VVTNRLRRFVIFGTFSKPVGTSAKARTEEIEKLTNRTIKITNRAVVLSNLRLFYPFQFLRESEEKSVQLPRKMKKTRIKRSSEKTKMVSVVITAGIPLKNHLTFAIEMYFV